MALSNLGNNIFIGDSAATSHMTSNKMGVYNLIPINRSRMIGNGQSFSFTNKGKLDEYDKQNIGVIFECTGPGTPQQNSVVERRIPRLVGRARAMLI